MSGLIGTKKGMTSLYNELGNSIPVTVIQAGPCVVTQVKTIETDGYNAVQIGYGVKKEKNTTRPMKGHFEKAGVEPQSKLVELRDFAGDYKSGDEINVDSFKAGDKVIIIATSKGKGFQGVVKRHGFKGVGMRTHGQHDRLRAPGSLGASSWTSRVFKGKRMGGRMGSDRIKLVTSIVQVLADQNLLIVKGNIPGSISSYVIVRKK